MRDACGTARAATARDRWRAARAVALLAACTLLLSCGGGGDGTGPGAPAGSSLTLSLSLSNVRPLDPEREGAYEAWLIDRAGQARSAGRFIPSADGRVTLATSVAGAVAIEITVEPPSAPAGPSAQRLLRGTFRGGHADLSLTGAVTRGDLPLRARPGQFTMFSPSDNAEHGYPSFEESGVWLFNMAPRQTEQNDMWVRLTPLQAGWVYEGWMVRDYGSPNAVWLSYGKFLPDDAGVVRARDDTGWGPFSGVLDFQTAGEEEFPGDDWISNPLDFPVPGGLTLPLSLREKTPAGESRWTHLITIEPAWKRGEPISSERPFLLRPYRDPFGDGGPGAPRTITLHADELPLGTADVK